MKESKRNRASVFCQQLLSLTLHRKNQNPGEADYTDEDKRRWSTPEERDGESPKAFSYVKPSGTPIHGAKGITWWWHSKPAMPTLPWCRFLVPTKTSRDECRGWVLRFIGNDDRPCPAESFGISGPARYTESWEQDMVWAVRGILVRSVRIWKDTRTCDVYELYHTLGIHSQWGLSAQEE